MVTTDSKPRPLSVLRSDALDTELVQFLSIRYLVTVEAHENEIIHELYNKPTKQ